MFFALTMWGFGLTCLHAVIQWASIQFWKMESYFWKSYVYPLLYFTGKLINNYYYIARLPSFVVVDLWYHFPVPLPIQLVNYSIRLEEEKSFEKFQKRRRRKVYAFDLPFLKSTAALVSSLAFSSKHLLFGLAKIYYHCYSSLLRKLTFNVGELIALPM